MLFAAGSGSVPGIKIKVAPRGVPGLAALLTGDEVHLARGATHGEQTVDQTLKRVSKTFTAAATIVGK